MSQSFNDDDWPGEQEYCHYLAAEREALSRDPYEPPEAELMQRLRSNSAC